MPGHLSSERLSFLGKRLPPAFAMRVVALASGGECVYDHGDWRDAIVVVERGQIELESSEGSRLCFRRGDVLWLIGMRLRAIHNRGREPAVLVAVSRRGERTHDA
jgi:hypothetical protein